MEEMEEMDRERKDKSGRLPVGKFFAWKSRDVSLAAITIVMMYLTIFCTDTLGLSSALVGTLLMVSKVFDGITSLFAGLIIDNTNTRWGKARPYELCIIGAWGCTLLLFFCSPQWGAAVKSIWVFVMYTLIFSIFSTLLGANMTPYMIRAFKGKEQITKVSSYGGIVTTLGAMVISITFPVLMAKLANAEGGWRTLILIYAIPLALIGILRFLFVKEEFSIEGEEKQQKVHVKQVLKMLKVNKYVWYFALLTGIYSLSVGLNAGTFYFTYIVGNIGMLSVMGMISIVLMPIMFIFPTLMKKTGVSKLIGIAAGLGALGYGIIFFAGDNVPVLFAGSMLAGIAGFPIAYLEVLVIMQLASFNEWSGLPRMEGSTNVVSSFASKVFSGIGTGMLGILLGAAGYISSAGNAVTVQPDSALLMIRCLYSIIPMICMILIVLLAFALSELEKMMPDIENDIEGSKYNKNVN